MTHGPGSPVPLHVTAPVPASEDLLRGIWKENPVLVQMLGLCPTLAVTNTVANSRKTIRNETSVGSSHTHQWPHEARAQIEPVAALTRVEDRRDALLWARLEHAPALVEVDDHHDARLGGDIPRCRATRWTAAGRRSSWTTTAP